MPCLVKDVELDNSVKTRRPFVGRINFNLANVKLDTEDSYAYSKYVSTTIHELFHVIAFHSAIITNFHEKVTYSQFPHLYALKSFNEKSK